jgi:acylphosphatase
VLGQVQGVGFRAMIIKLAQAHHINGFVRNGLDGSVEICAQGTDVDVQAFFDSIQNHSGRGKIDKMEIKTREKRETFSCFTIR